MFTVYIFINIGNARYTIKSNRCNGVFDAADEVARLNPKRRRKNLEQGPAVACYFEFRVMV